MGEVISVFGSSAPRPGDAVYELAVETGRLLAESGYVVATGGYGGVMGGASQGAATAGGYVVGITSGQIESFRPIPANEWVKEEIKYETLRERLVHLVENNAGMLTLPGGIGTLAEMSLAWSLIQVGELPRRPLILVGEMWRETINSFVDPQFVRAGDDALVQLADTPLEAVAMLNQQLKNV